MTRLSTTWKDLEIEVREAAEGWFAIEALDRESGMRRWQIRLDATAGRGDLFPHVSRPMIVDGVALLQTFGEHHRGATSHHHKLHCLSPTGELLWTHLWQIEPPVEQTEHGLLLVTRLANYNVPQDGHLFSIYLVGPQTGEIIKQRTIVLPAPWVRDLQATAWPQIKAQLAQMDGRWGIRVRAWLASRNEWAEYDVAPPW